MISIVLRNYALSITRLGQARFTTVPRRKSTRKRYCREKESAGPTKLVNISRISEME